MYQRPRSWGIGFGLNQFESDGSLITFLEVDRLTFGFVGLEPIGVEPTVHTKKLSREGVRFSLKPVTMLQPSA